jgi:hypothetical protein
METKESIHNFAVKSGISHYTYVAVAYWCDETWPIVVGTEFRAVEEAADRYLTMYPNKFDSHGEFINGVGADGYWIYQVPTLPNHVAN